MKNIDLESLTKKLDQASLKTLENAIGSSVSRTHYNVEIEHWLLAIIQEADTALLKLFQTYIINLSELEKELIDKIETFKTGNGRSPGLSPSIVRLLQNSWLHASLHFHASIISPINLMYTLIKISEDELEVFILPKEIQDLTTKEIDGFIKSMPKHRSQDQTKTQNKKSASVLEQFTTDLTRLAREKKIEPVIGRHIEIRQMIDILSRHKQNNPILTGEAGVGKTAVVEGLALQIAEGKAPSSLEKAAIHTLDLTALQAGAGIKGEFEKRLKSIIDAVELSPHPIILFIDEAHNLLGAGNQSGQGDAANILKPALARGRLKTIAATTWREYKKYFEKDSALTRRFQVVKIEEPSQESAVYMMRGLIETLEKHHHINILDEAIVAAVQLSSRYITARRLPDKSISLLDTAAARVHLSQTATPPKIEDLQKKYDLFQTELKYLMREENQGVNHRDKISDLKKSIITLENQIISLKKEWKREIELVKKIAVLRKEIDLSPDHPAKLTHQLNKLKLQFKKIQGEKPLIFDGVDSNMIATIVADWTGIPVGRMLHDEIVNMLNLENKLNKSILGQSSAIKTITKQLQITYANLQDPNKPRGVFLLAGSSGVGKTETAIVLANQLYGGEQNLTVINMSEFKESHKLSMLTGSPAGYVGFGEGGILTEAVRRNPYSVILLDEMEKAHPSIQEAFYQVFDKGIMMDGEGERIDFKNTLIIMTTNIGTKRMLKLHQEHGDNLQYMDILPQLKPELLQYFKAAFLGRVTTIPYSPLGNKILKGITKQKLNVIQNRMTHQYQADLHFSNPLLNAMIAKCQSLDTGARHLDTLINQELLPNIAAQCLQSVADEKPIKTINITIDKNSQFQYFLK